MQRTKRKETKRLTLIHKTLHIYCFLKKKWCSSLKYWMRKLMLKGKFESAKVPKV